MLFTKVSLLLSAVVFLLTSSLVKATLPPPRDPIDHSDGFAYVNLVPPPFKQPVGQPTPLGVAMEVSADKKVPQIGVAMEEPFEIAQQPPPVAMPPISQPIVMPPIGNSMPPYGYGIPIGQPISHLGYPSPVFAPVSIENDSASLSDISLSESPTDTPSATPSYLATIKPTQTPTKKAIRKMCRRRKLKIRINRHRNQRRVSAQDKMKMMRKKMDRKMKY